MAHTREKLVNDLKALGVQEGDELFIHSSFKSLGEVECGAATVIQALEDAVGKNGTILMPSFNLVKEDREKIWDVNTTPSTVGYLTEFFRKMPGTYRSDHYCHSVAARGNRARYFVDGHRGATGMKSPWDNPNYGCDFGDESPFVKLYKTPNSKILMIGVDYHSSTFCHFVEVKYWNERLASDPKAEYIWLWREKLGEYWDSVGNLNQGKIGNADSRLFKIKDFVDKLLDAVKKDPRPFLQIYAITDCRLMPALCNLI